MRSETTTRTKISARSPSTTFDDLRRPSTTFDDLRRPSTTFDDLRQPSTTFDDLRQPSTTFDDLRQPSTTFDNLRQPSTTFDNLRQPSGTFRHLPAPSGTFRHLPYTFRTATVTYRAYRNLRTPDSKCGVRNGTDKVDDKVSDKVKFPLGSGCLSLPWPTARTYRALTASLPCTYRSKPPTGWAVTGPVTASQTRFYWGIFIIDPSQSRHKPD
jgi:hypothetical protein